MTTRSQLLIVTGLSGAGKSTAMRCLEDLGTVCIDNLPPGLLPNLVGMHQAGRSQPKNLAVAIDVRGKDYFDHLTSTLEWLEASCPDHTIVFLDCHDDKLVERFSETRRRHPLADPGSLYDSIAAERESLSAIRAKADFVLDTTSMSPGELRRRIQELVEGAPSRKSFPIHVVSFGFKYGLPLDADIVFDVRFLPNPFYETGLRTLSGLSTEVQEFVMKFDESKQFVEELYNLVAPRIDAYLKEGKSRLTVAIGCTGGQHRSVTFAEILGKTFSRNGFLCYIRHRDSEHWPESRLGSEKRVV